MQAFIFLALVVLVSADNIRVEYKLSDYTNDGGVLATGKKCESNRHCDPKLTGYVDTEKAMNTWPGPKTDLSTWAPIFLGKDVDNVKINKIVSRDICRGDFTKANLRVKVVDVNKILSDKDITQFECLTGSARDVARNEASAQWSSPRQCAGSANPDKVRLTYSWRAYQLPSSQCGAAIGNTGTTKKSGFFGK